MADFDKHSVLPATEREAALRRIGYYRYQGSKNEPQVDRWSILNWFVKLVANETPLEQLSSAEVDLLRLEYRALQETAIPFYQNNVTATTIENLRRKVRRHLTELADTGRTTLGPFTTKRMIYRPDHVEMPNRQKVFTGEVIDPGDGQGLLHTLSSLLEREPLAVLRCSKCKRLFLQPRSDARYCSRPCQANAYAKKQREESKKLANTKSAKRNTRKSKHGKR